MLLPAAVVVSDVSLDLELPSSAQLRTATAATIASPPTIAAFLQKLPFFLVSEILVLLASGVSPCIGGLVGDPSGRLVSSLIGGAEGASTGSKATVSSAFSGVDLEFLPICLINSLGNNVPLFYVLLTST